MSQSSSKNPQQKHLKRHPGHRSQWRIGQMQVGSNTPALMAGPCAVESYEQLRQVADVLLALGVPCLRAGAFKPRTSPYNFQGMQAEGIALLARIREETGLAIVSEVMSIEQLPIMRDHVDCYQVGARNMQNFDLLKALGRERKPVLLKRGLCATVDEFLNAAEYILAGGNEQVILCERGIRSFDSSTRNVLDLGAVALLLEKTHLPVIVDPSHATGVRELVTPTARAAIAVGAHGLIVESHPDPARSVSDAAQALSFKELAELVRQVRIISEATAACTQGIEPVDQPLARPVVKHAVTGVIPTEAIPHSQQLRSVRASA